MSVIVKALPIERAGRWRLMESLIAEWFRPLTAADRLNAEELAQADEPLGRLLETQHGAASAPTRIRLPAALREWYEIAGKAKDVWSRSDTFLLPDQLYLHGDALVFYVENQAVVAWGVPLSQIGSDDPPVVIIDTGAGILGDEDCAEANRSISEFAIQMLLHNIRCSKYIRTAACGPGSFAAHRAIEERYEHVDLPKWIFPPALFFTGKEILIETEGNGDGRYIYATAKSEEAYSEFEKLMTKAGIDWLDWSKASVPWL